MENIYAIVIGIGDYQDPGISKLKYTHADAKAFAELLIDPDRCGIPKDQIKVLLDEEANCYNIKDSISDWLFQNAAEDSTAIIFFAGHGGSEPSRRSGGADASDKYLLPWDTKLKNLYASAISCLTFNDLLDRVHIKRKVIFMDACYSGGVAKAGSRDLNIIENPYSTLEGQGTVVVAASQPNQKSWEIESYGHGIFTYHLLEALKGEADLDKNGEITIWEVIEYLKKTVPKSASQLVKETQVPYWRGEGFGDIRLTVDTRIIRELKLQQNKEYQEKRLKVLNLYQKIPQNYIDEALELIKKDQVALNPEETDIMKFLDLLLKGEITVEQYLRYKNVISSENMISKVEPIKKEKPIQKEVKIDRSSEKPKDIKLKYCIKCGTEIKTNIRFCINCGASIKLN